MFNDRLFVRGTDIQEIFAQLGVEEATHAFYLGRELMKARLAITLGKTYRQEGALAWGYLTPPDDVRSEHVKLTQRRRRREAAARRGREPDGRTPGAAGRQSGHRGRSDRDRGAAFLDLPYLLFLDSATGTGTRDRPRRSSSAATPS